MGGGQRKCAHGGGVLPARGGEGGVAEQVIGPVRCGVFHAFLIVHELIDAAPLPLDPPQQRRKTGHGYGKGAPAVGIIRRDFREHVGCPADALFGDAIDPLPVLFAGIRTEERVRRVAVELGEVTAGCEMPKSDGSVRG